jgi:1,2-phenylacetyl-CoA epoxidase catalytic subunit
MILERKKKSVEYLWIESSQFSSVIIIIFFYDGNQTQYLKTLKTSSIKI